MSFVTAVPTVLNTAARPDLYHFGGQSTWRCGVCGAVTYAPQPGAGCRTLNNRADGFGALD